MKTFAIAIDGPAGAGKSSVARLLAQRLGYIYIDTGAMYRATTYKAIRLKTDLSDPASFAFLDETEMHFIDGVLFMDGADMSKPIRTNQVSNNVSVVASHVPVRNKLVAIQQRIASGNNVVMDGRDIGAIVLPEADLKIFMTATVEERARRRYEENLRLGIESDYAKLIHEIERRDKIDSSRSYNPLKQAEDAIALDTSKLDIDQVAETIYQMFINKIQDKR